MMYQLTEDGIKAFEAGINNITLEYLQQFESFKNFYGRNCSTDKKATTLPPTTETISPIESIENALTQLNNRLADDLIAEIMKMSPYEFEGLVVKLLVKIGYGDVQYGNSIVTTKSGDDGIDGIVTQDKLGFDSIYIQAKQWKIDSTVGQPDIQKFLGALAGQGATKGLFITTSSFSSKARTFVSKQLNHKIVLFDGAALTKLMIKYNLGVSTQKVYEVKRIDTDFFNEDL